MSWTTPFTAVTGTLITAAQLNASYRDDLLFLGTPLRAKGTRSTNKSLTSGSDTVYDMDAEEYDNGSFHSTSTNNSRLIAPIAAAYNVIAQVSFAGSSAGARQMQIRKNSAGASGGGTRLIQTADDARPSGAAMQFNGSCDVELTVGDYVEMFALQTTGGALNVNAADTYMSIRFAGLT